MTVYRLAVYAIEVGREDAAALYRHAVTRSIAGQLYHALGSAREARVWYRAAHPVVDPATIADRLDVLGQICRLLLTAIPIERDRLVRKRDR